MSARDLEEKRREEVETGYYASLSPEELDRAWASFEPGMRKGDVQQRLGTPQRVITREHDSTWVYPGGGTLDFDWNGRMVRIARPGSGGGPDPPDQP